MCLHDRPERARQERDRENLHRADSELAVDRRSAASERRPEIVELVEHAGAAIEKCPTLGRQRNVTRRAREETNVQLVLQLADRLADGGCGDVRRGGPATKAAGARDVPEVPQVRELHELIMSYQASMC